MAVTRIWSCQSARSGHPERDASGIVAFPMTRSSKLKKDCTTRFVTTRSTQQNKHHSRTPNFVTQDFQKTKGAPGVRWNDRGLAPLRKIPKIHRRLGQGYVVCLWSFRSNGGLELGQINWCPKMPKWLGHANCFISNDLDLLFWICGYIGELVNLAKWQCQIIFVARGCFGNCN